MLGKININKKVVIFYDFFNILGRFSNHLFPLDLVIISPVVKTIKYKTKAIKKTLTIPEWLNDEAIEQGLNFSQILQEALLLKLKNSKNLPF